VRRYSGGLDKLDPKLIASYTGGAVNVGLNAVVRRRATGPQYAITHPREIEYIVITKGSGTLVTGGTLNPADHRSDIYPNPIRTRSSAACMESREVSRGKSAWVIRSSISQARRTGSAKSTA